MNSIQRVSHWKQVWFLKCVFALSETITANQYHLFVSSSLSAQTQSKQTIKRKKEIEIIFYSVIERNDKQNWEQFHCVSIYFMSHLLFHFIFSMRTLKEIMHLHQADSGNQNLFEKEAGEGKRNYMRHLKTYYPPNNLLNKKN